jgi:hypothetical protein
MRKKQNKKGDWVDIAVFVITGIKNLLGLALIIAVIKWIWYLV